jgi:hypothetical protein
MSNAFALKPRTTAGRAAFFSSSFTTADADRALSMVSWSATSSQWASGEPVLAGVVVFG